MPCPYGSQARRARKRRWDSRRHRRRVAEAVSMAPSTYRSKYQFKFLATVALSLAWVCWGGVRSLHGQDVSGAPAIAGGAQEAQRVQQQGQQPAIKSDVRIVLVDVVVTGAKGEPAS